MLHGMGVGFVLIVYVFGAAALCIPAAAVGSCLGALLSRGPYRPLRKQFMLGGAVIPVAGAAYCIALIVAMAAFGLLTHRDFGFGDGFEVPLQNGYQFSAIDIPDIATLYRRGNSLIADGSSTEVAGSKGPVIDNVFALQADGDWLFGSRGVQNPRFADDKRVPDRWFLLNTKTLERDETDSEPNFESLVKAHSLHGTIIPSEDFYARHRWRWYDVVAALMLWSPMGIGVWLLVKLVKWRRRAVTDVSNRETNSDQDLTSPHRAHFLK